MFVHAYCHGENDDDEWMMVNQKIMDSAVLEICRHKIRNRIKIRNDQLNNAKS